MKWWRRDQSQRNYDRWHWYNYFVRTNAPPLPKREIDAAENKAADGWADNPRFPAPFVELREDLELREIREDIQDAAQRRSIGTNSGSH